MFFKNPYLVVARLRRNAYRYTTVVVLPPDALRKKFPFIYASISPEHIGGFLFEKILKSAANTIITSNVTVYLY